ncbi:PREDICTED: butyrophilin-like protein 2-like [Elephantulus edwardii]|uniref:butyrophilin-like protein 2-like n=1 Tax=Elephantulus edwardii TaxID=28737 RepID=UPI0003F0EF8E|nr:PREDICTED: butyrophilin-like protein 2-like [Elephantulus edwardii]
MHFQDACLHNCFIILLFVHLLLPVSHGNGNAHFNVIGPDGPILAILGKDVELPCYLIPNVSAENTELRGTTLVRGHISKDKAAVRIHTVPMFDNGTYHSHFKDGSNYGEAALWMKVAGKGFACLVILIFSEPNCLGLHPEISLRYNKEEGVQAECTSAGWFPEPQVEWRDFQGQIIPSVTNVSVSATSGLFSVVSKVVLRDKRMKGLSCSIANPLLLKKRVAKSYLPGNAHFNVIGPDGPLLPILGKDVELPCYLIPNVSAENMELRGYRDHSSPAVHLHQKGKDVYEEQMEEYWGRTTLVKDHITKNKAAVRIHNVPMFKKGTYHCHFKDGSNYGEAALWMKVAGKGFACLVILILSEPKGLGLQPVIRLRYDKEEGVRAECTSAGWFPEPQVEWRDFEGQIIPSVTNVSVSATSGLFSVVSKVVVNKKMMKGLSCSIANPVLLEKKVAKCYLAATFSRRFKPSPWRIALPLMLMPRGLVVAGAISIFLYVAEEEKEKTVGGNEKMQRGGATGPHRYLVGLGILAPNVGLRHGGFREGLSLKDTEGLAGRYRELRGSLGEYLPHGIKQPRKDVPITAFSYWNLINEILAARHFHKDVQDVVEKGKRFLKKELRKSQSFLNSDPGNYHKSLLNEVNSPPPEDKDSVKTPTVEEDINQDIPTQSCAPLKVDPADKLPLKEPSFPKALYPTLKILHLETNHDNNYLTPEEEADLKGEAAKYHSLDWPPPVLLAQQLPPYNLPWPLMSGPAFDPPQSYSFMLPGVSDPILEIKNLRESIQLKKKHNKLAK